MYSTKTIKVDGYTVVKIYRETDQVIDPQVKLVVPDKCDYLFSVVNAAEFIVALANLCDMTDDDVVEKAQNVAGLYPDVIFADYLTEGKLLL